MSSEVEADNWVDAGAIVEHERHTSHTHDGIVKLDMSYGFVTVELPEFCELWITSEVLCFLDGMTSFSRICLRE